VKTNLDRKRVLLYVLCLHILVPSFARAQPFVNPLFDRVFGGRAGCGGYSPHDPCNDTARGFGVAAGYIHDNLGFELEADHHQDFFGHRSVYDSTLFTIGAHGLLFASPSRIRPFALVGSGVARTTAGPGFNNVTTTSNALMLDVGAGVLAVVQRHVDLRADFRYVQIFDDLTTDLHISDGTFVHSSHLYRATVGALIHF